MKKILVTGGTGYIGSHTVVELINEGFEVLIIDDLSNSQRDVLDGIEKITGVRPAFFDFDLCDQQKLDQFFQTNPGINGIIHFAASKAVGESVLKPLLYYRNNVSALVLLLEKMKQYSVAEIVFSSSCTVYGQPDKLPVTEQSPFKPAESPYGNTKQIGEEILRDTCKAEKDIHAIALRYFNPVGAHPSALIGELPLGVPANLIPFITQTAAGIRSELKVFGNDYNTVDGSAVRDYIHINDLARAHVVAVKRMLNKQQKGNYEYFNIGTGKGLSVLEIIKAFERVNNLKLNYKIVERRAGDVEQVYADTTFANQELGWKATETIDEMMRSAWTWQQYLMSRESKK
ncbi:UDP-glucose 4-epimerase GalE [Pseudochryseolinea flava]|uniref:UDP-glucose 4-epimerase n=1 Tax=Pseudochryseolinea flava TaxID=2059302 RepID=A0A364Y4K9_9BACT|nr:UDP-glucose 4-epimerase GalE [Pseudochryseolinea flava]RAW01753.1 UDP-glucose 4-epimerase GalE [Pseudochryseolinea flava]